MDIIKATTLTMFLILQTLALLTSCKPVTSSTHTPVIIEGDIVYSNNVKEIISSSSEKRQKRKAIRGLIHYWENRTIPYTISLDLPDLTRKNIRLAFRRFQSKACLTFTPRTSIHSDYISFVHDKGCFSSVGRQGGRQKISLGSGCESTALAVHEILHALGFFHEQSRFDRDKYVKVLWWNIAPGKENNFNTYSHDKMDDLGFPYDVMSILHYDNKAFSVNGRDTLEKIGNPSLRFGEQNQMSSVDVQQLRELYKCREPHSVQRKKCSDRIPGCDSYSLQSDACESNFIFMKEYCKKSCAFCDM